MANEGNLVRNEDRTPEQRRANAIKAGKASAAKRKERKTFREGLLLMLEQQTKDKEGKETGKTVQEAMIAGIINKAMKGDTRAFELVRDTVGEKPAETVKLTNADSGVLNEIKKRMAADAP